MRLSSSLDFACRILNEGRFIEAAERFARLAADNPTDPVPRRGLASALARGGMTAEALAILTPLGAARPDDAGPRRDIADALAVTGRFAALWRWPRPTRGLTRSPRGSS